jgi:hypothetical protein
VLREVILVLCSGERFGLRDQCINRSSYALGPRTNEIWLEECLVSVNEDEEMLNACLDE